MGRATVAIRFVSVEEARARRAPSVFLLSPIKFERFRINKLRAVIRLVRFTIRRLRLLIYLLRVVTNLHRSLRLPVCVSSNESRWRNGCASRHRVYSRCPILPFCHDLMILVSRQGSVHALPAS